MHDELINFELDDFFIGTFVTICIMFYRNLCEIAGNVLIIVYENNKTEFTII